MKFYRIVDSYNDEVLVRGLTAREAVSDLLKMKRDTGALHLKIEEEKAPKSSK